MDITLRGSTNSAIENVENGAFLNLNIGGTAYRIRTVTLAKRADDDKLAYFARSNFNTRLDICDAYFTKNDEYYFERSPKLFEAIFKFYVTGELHRPTDICWQEFSSELMYWNISTDKARLCCPCCMHPSLNPTTERKNSISESGLRPQGIRARIHHFCEGDGTAASTIFSFASISFVMVSVLGLIFGSLHEFQQPVIKNLSRKLPGKLLSTNATNARIIWEPMPIFTYIETVCIVWFSFEYLLRLSVTPNRVHFLCSPMNAVDLIAILPFYLEITLAFCGVDVASLSDIKGALLVVRVLRVMRVVRILKLGRYSSGMRTFALTLRSSARQLGMMGMVLSTGVVFFSTLLYYVEKDELGTPFTSIPNTFWWAIVTMTTVGYGDLVPVTVAGKIIASGAIISGVLVLALPITIIVDNFMKVSVK